MYQKNPLPHVKVVAGEPWNSFWWVMYKNFVTVNFIYLICDLVFLHAMEIVKLKIMLVWFKLIGSLLIMLFYFIGWKERCAEYFPYSTYFGGIHSSATANSAYNQKSENAVNGSMNHSSVQNADSLASNGKLESFKELTIWTEMIQSLAKSFETWLCLNGVSEARYSSEGFVQRRVGCRSSEEGCELWWFHLLVCWKKIRFSYLTSSTSPLWNEFLLQMCIINFSSCF